jgi:DNA repair protein RecO (recombination protein O)
MALDISEGIILKMFNWSESSRTVVFFTRDFGKLGLFDRGGRRFKSRRGRLMPFARLEVMFYHSEKETRGYISDSNLLHAYSFEQEGTLGRLAYASAACELLYLLLSEEQEQEDLYDYSLGFLNVIESAPRESLPPVFLTFFIRLLSFLGYHPALGYCVGCGKPGEDIAKNEKSVSFSPERGGIVCGACKKPGDYYIQLSPESYRLLPALQSATLAQAAGIPVSYKETARLLEALIGFVGYQADIKAELKSLAFLEKLKNSNSMT